MRTSQVMPYQVAESFVSEVENEAIVLNYETKEIHRLEPAARFVFEKCDGKTSITEVDSAIRAKFGVGEGFIWSALGGFARKGLLASPWTLPETTRRDFIAKYGSAAALAPLGIVSMLAPAPAEAASYRRRRRPRRRRRRDD